MQLKLLSCEIFYREMCHLIAGTPHKCDVEFLPKGLHDLGDEKMRARLQERIDAVDPECYDALLLGYGLCNNGVVGLRAGSLKMVLPKSHDCIGLFMGCRQRYRQYFDAHPGTYYRTSGWLERDDASGAGEETVGQRLGIGVKYDELVREYGEDNAKYVMEMMGGGEQHYDRLTFIRMGLSCDPHFEKLAEAEAGEREWTFDAQEGSLEILRKLLHGDWDDDFLVIEPGQSIRASHDDDVVALDE